jgi:hypothetical protein
MQLQQALCGLNRRTHSSPTSRICYQIREGATVLGELVAEGGPPNQSLDGGALGVWRWRTSHCSFGPSRWLHDECATNSPSREAVPPSALGLTWLRSQLSPGRTMRSQIPQAVGSVLAYAARSRRQLRLWTSSAMMGDLPSLLSDAASEDDPLTSAQPAPNADERRVGERVVPAPLDLGSAPTDAQTLCGGRPFRLGPCRGRTTQDRCLGRRRRASSEGPEGQLHRPQSWTG